MSRNIAEIKAQMDTEQAAQSGLTTLNSTSQSAIYNLWKYITAAMIYFEETLWDLFKADLETIIDAAPVGTEQWVQDQVFKFQYSDTDPQIIQLINFVPTYATFSEALQIISRCSVATTTNKTVNVKVATSEPPQKLGTQSEASLISYLDDIGFAGTQFHVINENPDRLYLDADIYYQGQYASLIEDSVVAGIENYMANLPFDGIIKVTALEDAIQNVAGVTDVVINDMGVRASTLTCPGQLTYLVQNNETILRKSTLYSGYVIQEDTTSYTFLDKLSFTAE